MKYYHEKQSWEKAHAVEKADKWERSKDLSLRVYSVSKPKKSQENKENLKNKKSQEDFQNDKMIAIKLILHTTGKIKQKPLYFLFKTVVKILS